MKKICFFGIAFGLTISSIVVPKWVSYSNHKVRNAPPITILPCTNTSFNATALLLLWSPPPLLLPNRHLRKLPARRRLPRRRPLLLFHVALGRVPDVLCRGARGHKRGFVSDYFIRWKKAAGVGVEGAQFVDCIGGGCAGC